MSSEPSNLRLDIVVPVYNEAATLQVCIQQLHNHLTAAALASWRITIADNASTDDTPVIATALATEFDEVSVLRLEEKGRGRALKQAWGCSAADVLVYLDADLSTDLKALGPLVAPLLSGHSDLAIGTRLSRNSRVVRGGKREFISRTYNLLLRSTMSAGFSDAQCGFKAIRADIARRLLPLIEDDGWFFDTELLILAEHAGLRIHEVPVDWVDDPNSSVRLASTALADLRGMARVSTSLARGRLPIGDLRRDIGRAPFQAGHTSRLGRVLRFGLVGISSTALYALLYMIFQQSIAAQDANVFALLLSAVANTAANWWFTFRVRGPGGLVHQARGLAAFGFAWAITATSLAGLHSTDPAASASTSLVVLTAANLVATIVRYCLFSRWVFQPVRTSDSHHKPAFAGIPEPAIEQRVTTR